MSNLRTREWLLSQRHYSNSQTLKKYLKAKTISVTSGKGGVGKTSISLKIGKILVKMGYRVLVIDCDHNLSNTAVKLGIPVNNNFNLYLKNKLNFDSCLYKEGLFHLLTGCNGDLDIFDKNYELDRVVIDIIMNHENEYDYIILDSPAGIKKETLTINAYSDYRFVIVTPDKSSITDSYSLIKILNNRFGINDNHLLINKISHEIQYKKIVKTISDTVDHFLDCRLHILGSLPLVLDTVDSFDRLLLKSADSKIQQNLNKVLQRFTEDFSVGHCSVYGAANKKSQSFGHEVQSTIR